VSAFPKQRKEIKIMESLS